MGNERINRANITGRRGLGPSGDVYKRQGGKPFKIKCSLYKKKCIPDGDFQQTKGIRSEQPIETGKIEGFRKFDKVRYLGKEYFIKGRMSSGYAILMDISGKKVDFSDAPKGYKTPKLRNMKKLQARSTWMVCLLYTSISLTHEMN